ncbi:hypothetical protein GCM10010446_58090 [Streptomyces enissocaesilis]|uniref:Uncharacterized protein n=1 Tax=Streptomyces enissocaesilis TaxID=332589 RepID=A0ABN3XKY7_9ACTN
MEERPDTVAFGAALDAVLAYTAGATVSDATVSRLQDAILDIRLNLLGLPPGWRTPRLDTLDLGDRRSSRQAARSRSRVSRPAARSATAWHGGFLAAITRGSRWFRGEASCADRHPAFRGHFGGHPPLRLTVTQA